MNDERPIEKLLRRYAKKRRDDAEPPVELHPATRRLLQGEVTRQFRKDAPSDAPASLVQMLKGWRSQLAWAVPLFALVSIGLWSLLDRPATQQLALGPTPNQTTAAAPESQISSPKPKAAGVSVADVRLQTSDSGLSPASVPVGSLNQPAPDPDLSGKNRRAEQALAYVAAPDQPVVSPKDAAEQKGDPVSDRFKEGARTDKLGIVSSAAPARARFAETSSANRVNTSLANPTTETAATLQSDRSIKGASAANEKLNESDTRSFDGKASKPVAPLLDTPGPSATLARSNGLERDRAPTYSQSFANLAPEPLKQKTAKIVSPAPISPVLVNFRVEQTGRQLRVLDSDGSTYLGETDASPVVWAGIAGGKKEQIPQLLKRDGKLNQLPAAATSSLQPPAQNNFYRVAGTNRTLNQAVVFTWSFVEMTNPPVVAQTGKIGGDLNKDAQKLPGPFPAPLQNSFINGRAQFETGKEIEINAVPVSP